MALLFCDSFDHYAVGDISSKWKTAAGTGGSRAIVSGRFGNCFQCNNTQDYVKYQWGTSPQTLIAGFAWQQTGTDTNGRVGLVAFFDGATQQVDLRINNAGQLFITRANTTLATSGTVLSNNVWYYIEIKVKFASGTSGTYEVHVNGVQDAALTSAAANTQNGGAQATIVALGGNAFNTGLGGQGASNNRIDDFYLCDTSGSVNNNFLGDVHVEALSPNGNGTYSAFAGSDGNSTDNYLLVDDAQPSGDTDYVADATVGDKDTYSFTDPTPTAGTVYGVQISHYSRKTDAGTRSARSMARLAGTETDNGADQPLSTTYQYFSDMRETKPAGGAWSLSDVANAEFGVKVAA